MKRLLTASNVIVSFLVGLFFGSFAAGFIALVVFKYPALTDCLTNKSFNFILLTTILCGGTLGVYMELKKNTAKIIRFFQGNIVRKTYPVLCAILAFLFWDARDKFLYDKYRIFADEIVKTVSDSVYSGDMTPEIDNRLKIDYILVTEAYSLTEENLLKTGKISKKLAKSMAQRNASTEGTYLHIAKKDRVMAVKSFKPGIDVDNRFQLSRVGNKIKFHIQKKTAKDSFGKKNVKFVIYAIE